MYRTHNLAAPDAPTPCQPTRATPACARHRGVPQNRRSSLSKLIAPSATKQWGRVNEADRFDGLEQYMEKSQRRPDVQWYPGHIAKAEMRLKEQLKSVDVLIEVRDARIPAATSHPKLQEWVGQAGMVIVLMNKMDLVSEGDKKAWERYFKVTGQKMYWTNCQAGIGIKQVSKAALTTSQGIQAKREKRGMLPRPVRTAVVGYPNVGKSTIINRLLGKTACNVGSKPGWTRTLSWVRIGDNLELLDSPGIIPMKLHNQTAAYKLCVCDTIGEKSYYEFNMAAHLIDVINAHPRAGTIQQLVAEQFGLSPRGMSGAAYMRKMVDEMYTGRDAYGGMMLLMAYRKGRLGHFALEYPEGEFYKGESKTKAKDSEERKLRDRRKAKLRRNPNSKLIG